MISGMVQGHQWDKVDETFGAEEFMQRVGAVLTAIEYMFSLYIYICIYIYGMVVSRGNYPLVICHIAIENGPNRNS